jgi:hypothetical protein
MPSLALIQSKASAANAFFPTISPYWQTTPRLADLQQDYVCACMACGEHDTLPEQVRMPLQHLRYMCKQKVLQVSPVPWTVEIHVKQVGL